METDELNPPFDDWLVETERGYKVNKALIAENVAYDEGGNLICVNLTFWKYSGGVWKRKEDAQIKARIRREISKREDVATSKWSPERTYS